MDSKRRNTISHRKKRRNRRNTISQIKRRAEHGNPHMMLMLANLYKAGAFGDLYYSEYVFWLKEFFNNEKVDAMVRYLEDKDNYDYPALSFEEQATIRNDIIIAGTSLGIYYCGSSSKEELLDAIHWFMAALDASAWDNLEDEHKRSIKDLLTQTEERFHMLGYEVDA